MDFQEFKNMCRKFLDASHVHCLYDAEYAIRFADAMASIPLRTKNPKLRFLTLEFLSLLHEDYKNSRELQLRNKYAFHNSVRLFGEYVYKVTLNESNPHVPIFPPYLKGYLHMLLESLQSDDLEVFALQLYMNGHYLKNFVKLDQVLLQIRLIFSSNMIMSRRARLWLLFAMDVANNNYELLSPDLQRFYKIMLGNTSDARLEFDRINNLFVASLTQKMYESQATARRHRRENACPPHPSSPLPEWCTCVY